MVEKRVVGDYIKTIKTTFEFNFELNQTFKKHDTHKQYDKHKHGINEKLIILKKLVDNQNLNKNPSPLY